MKRFKLQLVVVGLALGLVLPFYLSAAQIRLPNDVAWVAGADTYRECVQQAYLNASNRLQKLAPAEKPGTWCVVLDADETVISNIGFQKELAATGAKYSSGAWTAWCKKKASTALPGAAEFCALAQKLGGKVIIVTNRKGAVKYYTKKNLKKAGIPFDILLVREGPYAKDRSKVLRRKDIEAGDIKTLSAQEKLPPLKILMRAGDQTHDLYDDQTKKFADVKDRFGTDLIVIPNPMYGDWATKGVFVEGSAPAPAVQTYHTGSGAITWQEAMEKVGQDVVVEAKVVSIYDPEARGRKGPVKLNVDRNYHNSLTFVFYKNNREGNSNGFKPPMAYKYQTVRVKGKVSEYKGSKQIKVHSPADLQIIGQ
jgi:5'-nucleotidase (lipoprotein e(P4) family)